MNRLVLLLLALPALAQDFDHLLETYTAEHHFMGTVLAARGNQVLFSKGYGFANLEWRVPNDPTTKFRIASLTKQFTAAAILLLEERGKLSIDDPVKKHLPDAPEAWDKITLRHLLTHTSGIPEFLDMPGFTGMKATATTSAELVALFRNQPLDFEPGSEFRYSNSGYIVLTYLIEKISGVSYGDFLRENIFAPLEMTNSGYDSNSAVITHRAAGYVYGADGFENAAFIDMSIPEGAGGLYSTTEDLFKWTQGLFGGRVLRPESLAKMTKPFLDNYGLGLAIENSGGRKAIRHSGGIDGFDTDLAYYPDDQLTVVVLSNVEADGPDSESLGTDLANLVHGVKHSGVVFTGALERVRKGFLTLRLAGGVEVAAALPPSGDLAANAIAPRYHLADQVQITCAETKTVYDSEASLHLHVAVKSIELVRPASSREQAEMADALAWRSGPNLLKNPAPGATISAAGAQAAMDDFARVRKVNLRRVDNMPNFVADETARRYRSEGIGQPWKLMDTLESEVSMAQEKTAHRLIRRNGKPTRQLWNKLSGPKWGMFLGVELEMLDADCSTRFDFAGFQTIGGKQLRMYRFNAPPGGDCLVAVKTSNQEYGPARSGRILVDPARAEVLHLEYEGSRFPEKFPVDRLRETVSWGYVTIGTAAYLVPLAATMNFSHADGSSLFITIEYRNYRHFEASTDVTYGPGK